MTKRINTSGGKSPPDGGWGWMVVFGVALTNIFNQSLVSIFGLLFGEHLKEMGQGTLGAALIMNINSVVLNFSGLITGPALKYYSTRTVAIIGSLLTSTGLILSSQSTQLWQITISYGLFVGLGLGLINPSSFIAVNSYFSSKRGRAVGLALAGTGAGQMIMPHIVRLLLDNYGFSGATIIIGSLALNGVVGASLFQPVEWHTKIRDNFDEKNILLNMRCESDLETEPIATSINNYNNNSLAINSNTSVLISTGSQYSSVNDNRPNLANISKSKATFKNKITKTMDLHLLKDPVFISIAIGLALAYTASTNFSMLFPYFLQESAGLSRSDTALCMSILAAADLASRLSLPAITDRFKITCRIIFLIGTVLLTFTRTILAKTSNRTDLLIISGCYGYVRATTVVNQNLTIAEYATEDKLANALGLNMIIKGIFVISIGQLLGWVRDYSDSYPICMYVQNILLIIVILMWTPEIIYRKCTNLKNRKIYKPKNVIGI